MSKGQEIAKSKATDGGRKRRNFLNKFLSKTYHMVDQCDPDIASWSESGESFTVKDVSLFEQNVLPKYFNHSKFSSFIRQLNFYGFQKLRADADLQVHTSSVRFAHEFFKKDRLDLLHKIQRATSVRGPVHVALGATVGLDCLQNELEDLKAHVHNLETQMDERVERAASEIEKRYQARIDVLEESHNRLHRTLLNQYEQLKTTPLPSLAYLSAFPKLSQPQLWQLSTLKSSLGSSSSSN